MLIIFAMGSPRPAAWCKPPSTSLNLPSLQYKGENKMEKLDDPGKRDHLPVSVTGKTVTTGGKVI